MKRNFIISKGYNANIWTIAVNEASLVTSFGASYSEPKHNTKTFDSIEKCEKEALKLIDKKMKDGYQEVMLQIPDVPIDLLFKVEEAQREQPKELAIDVKGSVAFAKEIAKIQSLTKLVISGLAEFPAELSQLLQLEKLEIESSYQLERLPEEFGQLRQLKNLSIRNTAIRGLPESIGALQLLRTIDIWSNNFLQHIPESFSNLTALKTCWIVYNRESYSKTKLSPLVLPDGLFARMTDLVELHLNSNDIENLPAGMEQLKQCKELQLNDNLLSEFPLMITEMESLEKLQIGSNRIHTIPEEILRLTRLSRFSCGEGMVKNIPEALLNKGMKGIMEFFHPELISKTEKKSVEPAPDNHAEIVVQYEERITQFLRDVKDRMYKEEHLKALDELIQFFKGETDIYPDFLTNDNEYYFRSVCQLFSPFKEWTFIELRILMVMTGDQWSTRNDNTGWHESFYKWLANQLRANDYPGFYKAAMQVLLSLGCSEKMHLEHTLRRMCYNLHEKDDQYTPSSMDDYLMEQSVEHLPMMINIAKEYGYTRTYLAQQLVKYQEEALQPYIPDLSAMYTSSESGLEHVRYDVLDKFCEHDNARYEPLVVEQLNKVTCQSCRAELARILKKHNGSIHHELSKEICLKTLEHITETLNKDHEFKFKWSQESGYTDGSKKFVEYVANTFGYEVRDEIFLFVKNTKVLSLDNIGTALSVYKQDAIDIAAEGLKMTINGNDMASFYRKFFTMLAPFDFSAYYDKVWEVAVSAFREVAQTACLLLSRQPLAVVRVQTAEYLCSKQADTRYAGIMVAGLTGAPEMLQLLEPLLESEKNEELRDQVVNFVYRQPVVLNIESAKQRIAATAKRGKLDKPVAKWLTGVELPALFWNDGTALDQTAVNFLLYRQSRLKDIGPEKEARDIYPLIDRNKSADFALALLKLVMKNGGAKAPNRFGLSLAALLGDGEVLPTLMETAIEDKNENACIALGWQGSLEAAFALDKIVLFFKTKYPNVRNAATEAFELIADNRNLSASELKDKIIPDFGFVNRKWQFSNGKDQVCVSVDRNMKLLLEDAQGKKIASLPKTFDDAAKKVFKQTSADIRDAAKQLAINLENYLCTQRKWSVTDWNAFFLNHPLAFALAQNFVWGAYGNRELKQLFMLKQDGTLTDVANKEIEWQPAHKIGLVHPIELSDEQIAQWQQLAGNSKTPFPQLNRKTYHAGEELRGKCFSYVYEHKKQDGDNFKNTAGKLGWQRGSVIDSGAVSAFRKRYTQEQLEVFVMTENLGVQGFDTEMSFGRLFFVKLGAVVTGSYTYDEPRDELDPRLIPLNEVPRIVYSETISNMEVLTTKKKEEKEA